MNPVDRAPGNASRRAALLLHAMAPADQAWLLAGLPPARRERLQALLGELQDLGIPADAPLLQSLVEREVPASPIGAVQRLQLLSGDEVAWLAARLQEEPPEVAALLLAHQAWPWRAALLEQLDPVRQQRVATGGAADPLPLPAAVLCEAVLRMIPLLPPAPPASGARRLWDRLRLPTIGTAPR